MMPLQTHIHISSEQGLSSITTLIVGSKSAALIDPPFLIPDARSVVKWIQDTTSLPLKAVFVTHHHPDHFFSANPILEAFQEARFLTAPYVRAGIDREYEEKVKYWPSVMGKEMVPEKPRKPDVFEHSFFVLDGDEQSPICLLGPVQGDSIDQTLFWLPTEKTVVCGDVIYARSTHVWAAEIETPQILHAWQKSLDLIASLNATKIIPGHLEKGWEMDGQADLAHTRKYLQLFDDLIQNASQKHKVDELYQKFKEAFPEADKNLDFFLGQLSNAFGQGGQKWEENRHHNVDQRTKEQLEGFVI